LIFDRLILGLGLVCKGRLKTRDLTSRDHQNCGDWHRGTRSNRSRRCMEYYLSFSCQL